MKLFLVTVPNLNNPKVRDKHLVQARCKSRCKALVKKTAFGTPFNRYNEIGVSFDDSRERVII